MTTESGDSGTTLAELTIAMLVFGIFATFLSTVVLQTTRLAGDSAVRETTVQTASTVMAQVTKDLRTALRIGPTTGEQIAFACAPTPAPACATPTEVSFYSGVAPAPVRERLYLAAGALHRETKVPDVGSTYPDLRYASTDSTRTTTRRLGAGLQTDVTFTYFLRGSTDPLSTVTSAQLKDIAAVAVRISVDGDGPGKLRPVVLESTVRPYNL